MASDLPILSPSECAKLKEFVTNGMNESLLHFAPYASGGLRESMLRMLATIAALRIEVDMWEGVNRSKSLGCDHFAVYSFTEDGGQTIFCTLCRIAAHEATIAELRKQLDAWRDDAIGDALNDPRVPEERKC